MTRRITLVLLSLTISHSISFAQKSPEKDFGNSRAPVNMVMFAGNNTQLIAGGYMKIWDVNNPSAPLYRQFEQGMEFSNAMVLNADISDDGRYAAIVSAMRLDIYDIPSRSIINTIRGIGLAGVAFGPDNSFAFVNNSGVLKVYDIGGQPLAENKYKSTKANRVAWSKSGKYMAIGGRGDEVVLLDYNTKNLIAGINIGNKAVTDLEFSPDNNYLAIAQASGSITIVEASSGNPIKSWLAHQNGTRALAFHPSGKFLASGGDNNMVIIWKIPEWEPAESWIAHEKAVTALDFSSDGRMIASGSFNVPLVGSVNDTKIWTLDRSYMLAEGIDAERIQPEEAAIQPALKTQDPVNLPENNNASQKRLALIIGNGMYLNGGVLANPENDANDIGERLRALGFDVMLYNNLDQRSFRIAIDEFGTKLASYDIGLFYYAGHGIQVKGNNYLIPVDANLSSENDVEYDCVNTGRLLAKMEDAGSTTNIIILDACRDNPFERSWRRSTHGQGLAFMTAPAGSLISYATSPGATASDGSGRNGLFTTALLEYIDEPNLSLLEMFQKVRTYVRENSGGEQVPWESTSLEGNFYFKSQNN